MKREIKFRAWLKDCEKMLQIESLNWSETLSIRNDLLLDNKGKMIHMQYTGLKDKNGKEIYEGDIVEYSSSKFIGEVSYSTIGGCSFKLYENGILSENGRLKDLQTTSDLKVIGNIYENKELINNNKQNDREKSTNKRSRRSNKG